MNGTEKSVEAQLRQLRRDVDALYTGFFILSFAGEGAWMWWYSGSWGSTVGLAIVAVLWLLMRFTFMSQPE